MASTRIYESLAHVQRIEAASRLLRLPPELRHLVLLQVILTMGPSKSINLKEVRPTAMLTGGKTAAFRILSPYANVVRGVLSSCRQLRAETQHIFLTEGLLYIPDRIAIRSVGADGGHARRVVYNLRFSNGLLSSSAEEERLRRWSGRIKAISEGMPGLKYLRCGLELQNDFEDSNTKATTIDHIVKIFAAVRDTVKLELSAIGWADGSEHVRQTWSEMLKECMDRLKFAEDRIADEDEEDDWYLGATMPLRLM